MPYQGRLPYLSLKYPETSPVSCILGATTRSGDTVSFTQADTRSCFFSTPIFRTVVFSTGRRVAGLRVAGRRVAGLVEMVLVVTDLILGYVSFGDDDDENKPPISVFCFLAGFLAGFTVFSTLSDLASFSFLFGARMVLCLLFLPLD